jgi:peptidyl-tRNA hydrolase, PTH1 family
MVLDEAARRMGATPWKSKSQALIAAVAVRDLLLVKPQTFMNASGEAVASIAARQKTPRPSILVIYDDLDIPFGRLRMRKDGSAGGHNGMKSLIACLGGQDFPRLRIGIGRGEHDAIDHVLSPFKPDESERLAGIIAAAADGAQQWLTNDFEKAASFVNARREDSEAPPGG